MTQFSRALAVAAIAAFVTSSASANQSINLMLNWVPGADHAPIFYALDAGHYTEAGITLNIQSGKGSAMSAQAVGVGSSPIGISEVGTAFLANGKGADVVAVMAIYANSPFVLYWKKSSGISSPKDFAGRTLGNPPGDAARAMWPAFAAAAGLPADAVTFVNVSPQAKVPTLAAGRVDMISDFYNGHDLKIREFGDDLGHIRWSEVGLNPYGNSFIVNRKYLEANRDTVAKFIAVTQKAYAACVRDEDPCIRALLRNASGLEERAMRDQWGRVKELMADKFTTTKGLGHLDADRIVQTYELVNTYFKLDTPFDPKQAFTSEFLSPEVLMTAQ